MLGEFALGGFEPLAVAAGGFVLKYAAMQQQMLALAFKQRIQEKEADDESADRAAKRDGAGGAITRRILAFCIVGVIFLGAIAAACMEWQTVYLHVTEVKTHLFGAFETGGKVKEVVSDGFVLTPEMRRLAVDVVFFYFGVGTAKFKL